MAYQVKNTRNDDGSYTLSYGKGSKKLVATMRCGPNGWFYGSSTQTFKTMKECKAAWGRWAEQKYHGTTLTPTPTAPPTKASRGDWETDDDRQRLIDEAPDAETAEHRYAIAVATEDMVQHEHELAGEPYTPTRFRRRIPRRPKMETV